MGLLSKGNIDLTNRPRVQNPDGSISTVRSVGVNIDGKEVLLPTVADDGTNMDVQQAVQNYRKTGKHLGIFSDVASSNAYAQSLHEQQAKTLEKPMAKKAPMSDLMDAMRDSQGLPVPKSKLTQAASGQPVAPMPKPAGVTSSVTATSTDPRQTPFVKTANLQAIDDKAPPSDGMNDALYKGIIAAVPTLIGAAFGNTGGAVGAEAGGVAIKDYDTQKKVALASAQLNEKTRYDRAVQGQKLANEAEGLSIRQQDVNQKGLLRKQMRGQHEADKDFEHKRQYQHDFDVDPQVRKVSETKQLLDELRGHLKTGDGQAAKAVQFRLATLFNGGRPTEADVQAFKGSPTALNGIKTWLGVKVTDQMTPENIKIYNGLINTMSGSSERALARMADIHSKQASVRFGRPAAELKGWLKLDHTPETEEIHAPGGAGDDAEKNALIESIMGGGS